MSRYIDANQIQWHSNWLISDDKRIFAYQDEVDNIPAADVVEVVRCKDCAYCEHWYRDKGLCALWAENGIDVFEDGFCSYGKRREKTDERDHTV